MRKSLARRVCNAPLVSTPSNSAIGSRGGKRSVTHLSKAQLARKRANDREAQRNIRQRTKEHIETLEQKVRDLEQGTRAGSMERVLRRNQELEVEVERLKAQVASTNSPTIAAPAPPKIAEELLIPQKATLNWMPETAATWIPRSSHGPAPPTSDPSITNVNYPHVPSQQVYTQPVVRMVYDDEQPQQMYSPSESSVWDETETFGPHCTTQALTSSVPAWAPFDPVYSQPSRFSDLQATEFNNVVSQPNYNTTCWQNQPATYAWQISTKLKSPSTYLDKLMLNVIQSQRHLSATSDASTTEVMGPTFPSVHILFDQPGPPGKGANNMGKVMERYAAVLSNRGFSLIPERLASFMCMYRFIQWQICPTYETYKTLHEWQAPCDAQLTIPHPAWMDLPPWGKFREQVIENQDKYDNAEFQSDYAGSLCVNFPFDHMKALIFDAGEMKISPMLDKHLSDINNMSMKKVFGDKYPEFRSVCRVDEV